jgi:1-acyl-sn-glycerol-3-phosphate acyltransferase
MQQRRLSQRLWYEFCKFWCRLFCRLFFRFSWSGAEHVPPTGPMLLVSNHQSHLDPVFAGIACPRQLEAFARHTLFVGPFGWLIRSLGAVPVDRQQSITSGIRAILKLLRDGRAVLFFPEGTRTYDGRLQPLEPGFCAIARRGEATIVPIAIHGAFDAMPRGAGFPRPTRVSLVFSPPITPDQAKRASDEELLALVAERIDPNVTHMM